MRKTAQGEPQQAIVAALGTEFYTKYVIVVDDDVDIYDMSDVMWAVATRVHAEKDIVLIPGCKGAILDPTSDPETFTVTKMGIDATRPVGQDFAERLVISEEQRACIHDAARSICAVAGYTGVGTVEFLLSESGVISFLEVNTRLQVEHPVTEETTGVDIVTEQLRIADGLPLSINETPEPQGHAFEFRINAEDPGRGFLPTPGLISRFRAPSGPGIRIDTGVERGSEMSGLYDSLMAKLIVTGATREQALARALESGKISGAGFDVATKEPPPADHPLMKLLAYPNFILTPHVAWSSREAITTLAAQVTENIELFMRGTPPNLVG